MLKHSCKEIQTDPSRQRYLEYALRSEYLIQWNTTHTAESSTWCPCVQSWSVFLDSVTSECAWTTVPFHCLSESLILIGDIFQNAHTRANLPTYIWSQEKFLWESRWLRNSRALPNWNEFRSSTACDQFITEASDKGVARNFPATNHEKQLRGNKAAAAWAFNNLLNLGSIRAPKGLVVNTEEIKTRDYLLCWAIMSFLLISPGTDSSCSSVDSLRK